MVSRGKNHLQDQTSPYLLQHAENPVDWYPWCEEAFARAKREDKPVFLSIGYSTCHWCHVMVHESFENEQVAEILNEHYISIKVDKEERPDIDSIYMEVCQAFTGSGGWPTTVLMTPEQKPFFAGTYFPPNTRHGQIGLMELLALIAERWTADRALLLDSAEEMVEYLRAQFTKIDTEEQAIADGGKLIERAIKSYKHRFDAKCGGFGRPPKFPMPHNLLFLMRYYERNQDEEVLYMVNKTLLEMFRGGLHDHIGGGFCRYSTDRRFLVPHFEKMLYDNALLIRTYSKAYQLTKKELYREIAERTAGYVLREMRSCEGAFYSAQDADSEGEEGKYYLFVPSELEELLGKEAAGIFNRQFDITENGNFEGKNIPNLLKEAQVEECPACGISESVKKVYEYRKDRYILHTDDKILTAWNALMIAALADLYRVTENESYLLAAIDAQHFLEEKLCEEDTLYVSYRDGRRGGKGFLDDYGYEIYALLSLYEATFRMQYLQRAERLCDKVWEDFGDEKEGGFFLNGEENEQLLLRPKQTADGALFSGNSVMAYNLVHLSYLTGKERHMKKAGQQIAFMCGEAGEFPAGYAFALTAILDDLYLPDKIVVACKEGGVPEISPCQISLDTLVRILETPSEEYPLKNDRTTYYVCKENICLPPTNDL